MRALAHEDGRKEITDSRRNEEKEEAGECPSQSSLLTWVLVAGPYYLRVTHSLLMPRSVQEV